MRAGWMAIMTIASMVVTAEVQAGDAAIESVQAQVQSLSNSIPGMIKKSTDACNGLFCGY